MNSDNRWLFSFAARVFCNALAGGLWFALVGALCIGAGGGLTGAILDFARVMGDSIYTPQGIRIGVQLGILSGVAGVFVFGIAALKAAPGRFFAPLRALGGRVALGQFLGALGAATSFFLFEYINAHLHGQRFASHVSRDIFYILLGGPTLMLCGAIAGALSRRR